MINVDKYSAGQRWISKPVGKAHFYFIIIGEGLNASGNPSRGHKWCKIQVLPKDIEGKLPGFERDGLETSFSHKHLRRYATHVLE